MKIQVNEAEDQRGSPNETEWVQLMDFETYQSGKEVSGSRCNGSSPLYTTSVGIGGLHGGQYGYLIIGARAGFRTPHEASQNLFHFVLHACLVLRVLNVLMRIVILVGYRCSCSLMVLSGIVILAFRCCNFSELPFGFTSRLCCCNFRTG